MASALLVNVRNRDASGVADRPTVRAIANGSRTMPEAGAVYAALDLGTNNCRLLVARPTYDSFRVVDAFSRIIRLGEGLTLSGRISDAAIDRAVSALGICRDKMSARGVMRARLIATEACRAAENGAYFCARIAEEVGLELEVVDRETEANLAATGCAPLVAPDAEGVILFDIGGGSSELVRLGRVFANGSGPPSAEIKAWTSLPIGVVTLAERHGGVVVSPATYEAMVQEVAAHIAPFVQRYGEADVSRLHLLGTSGTVTTIAGVHLQLPRYDRRRVDGAWLSRTADFRRRRAAAGDGLRGPRRQSLHRRRARRPGARRLRHSRSDPPRLPLYAPARRRPRPARRHAGADDARGRRLGRAAGAGLSSDMNTTRGSGGRDLKVRVRSGRGRSTSSRAWLQRQLNDPYVARARREGFRSRAAFKLAEIDDRFHFLKPGARVVDLGAAPGGWSQVAAPRVGAEAGQGRIVAIDVLEMVPVPGVEFRRLDFLDPAAPEAIKAMLGGGADVVLSDMAANATGHRQTDHLKIVALVEAAADFACEVLNPGGVFLAKVLQGGTETELLARLKRHFTSVKHVKPAASRADSAELYVLATGFRQPTR